MPFSYFHPENTYTEFRTPSEPQGDADDTRILQLGPKFYTTAMRGIERENAMSRELRDERKALQT